VDLGDGRDLPADIYLSVVGVDPNLEFLAGSGIQIGHGILVDEHLQSSGCRRLRAGDVTEAANVSPGSGS